MSADALHAPRPRPGPPGEPPRPVASTAAWSIWFGILAVTVVSGVLALVVLAHQAERARFLTVSVPTTIDEHANATRPTTTRGPTTTSPAGGPSSADHPLPKGTEVTPAAGWSVRIESVDLDGLPIVQARSVASVSDDRDHRFVLVYATVTNHTDRPAGYGSGLTASLVAPSGHRYEADSCNQISGLSWFSPADAIAPGASVSEDLCFVAGTDDVTGAALRVEPASTAAPADGVRYLGLD